MGLKIFCGTDNSLLEPAPLAWRPDTRKIYSQSNLRYFLVCVYLYIWILCETRRPPPFRTMLFLAERMKVPRVFISSDGIMSQGDTFIGYLVNDVRSHCALLLSKFPYSIVQFSTHCYLMKLFSLSLSTFFYSLFLHRVVDVIRNGYLTTHLGLILYVTFFAWVDSNLPPLLEMYVYVCMCREEMFSGCVLLFSSGCCRGGNNMPGRIPFLLYSSSAWLKQKFEI